MKYFYYNADHFVISPSASKLSVRAMLAGAQETKNAYKKLIQTQGKGMEPWEVLTEIKRFYGIESKTLYNEEWIRVMNEYPEKITVKTNYVQDSFYKEKLALTLRVKEGVKLNKHKVYSASEIDDLLASGQAKVIDTKPYKKKPKASECVTVWKDNYPILDDCIYCQVIFEEDYTNLVETNPRVVDALFADIDFEQMADDYKNKFLPDYKEYLKVLLERAKELAKQNKNEQKIVEDKLQKQIQEGEEISKLASSIIDASKGR